LVRAQEEEQNTKPLQKCKGFFYLRPLEGLEEPRWDGRAVRKCPAEIFSEGAEERAGKNDETFSYV
jgi:hypothetical protein